VDSQLAHEKSKRIDKESINAFVTNNSIRNCTVIYQETTALTLMSKETTSRKELLELLLSSVHPVGKIAKKKTV